MQEGWFLSSAKVSPPTVTDKRVCMEGWARAQMCSGASGGRGPGTSSPVLEKPLPAGGLSLLGCRTSKEWPSSLLPSWARRAGGKVLPWWVSCREDPWEWWDSRKKQPTCQELQGVCGGLQGFRDLDGKKSPPEQGGNVKGPPCGHPAGSLAQDGSTPCVGYPREDWPWHRLSLLSWLACCGGSRRESAPAASRRSSCILSWRRVLAHLEPCGHIWFPFTHTAVGEHMAFGASAECF